MLTGLLLIWVDVEAGAVGAVLSVPAIDVASQDSVVDASLQAGALFVER
jgi:hypothetical protein